MHQRRLVEFDRGLVNAFALARRGGDGGERMKSNVVPISRARSVARRTPARKHLRPLAGRKAAEAPRPVASAASLHDTPIWLSILALLAITMWPSALVWTVQLAYRIGAW
jgi:hypothetical protein